MKKIFTFIFFIKITLVSTVFAQSPRYLIEFNDKDTSNNHFSLNEPEDFLSSKSLERRERQNIDLVSEDLPISQRYIDSVRSVGVKIQNKSKWLNSVVGEIDSSKLNTLRDIDFIKELTYLAPAKAKKGETKNKGTQNFKVTDKFRHKKKNIDSTIYGYADNQILMLNGNYLHEKGYQGQGMTIAVIDAGFLMTDTISVFDELWANGQILGQRDFEEPGHDIYQQGNSGHGTYVFSIMGGREPGNFYGTAPKADYWLLRSEVASSEYVIEEYNWVAAAEFADSAGVDIINTSLGYTRFDDSTQDHTYSDMDGESTIISQAASTAASKGMLLVVSAGNKGNDPWKYISAPADAKDILSVGAVDSEEKYASFSSVGPSSDNRTKPELSAQGQRTFFAAPDGSIAAGNGTSFAAPVIAGLSACLWQKYPEKTYKEIKEQIMKSAHQYSNPDSLKGYGLPDFEEAYALTIGEKSKKMIKAYPNPFQDSFFVSLPDVSISTEQIVVTLYDVVGRKIFEQAYSPKKKGSRIKITPQKSVEEGVYFLNVKYTDSYRLRTKMVKQ
ncbi:MAG: S8 family serine peptidase [Bacteroidota bacterium]